jgi:hypothetical protein
MCIKQRRDWHFNIYNHSTRCARRVCVSGMLWGPWPDSPINEEAVELQASHPRGLLGQLDRNKTTGPTTTSGCNRAGLTRFRPVTWWLLGRVWAQLRPRNQKSDPTRLDPPPRWAGFGEIISFSGRPANPAVDPLQRCVFIMIIHLRICEGLCIYVFENLSLHLLAHHQLRSF